ncbi:TPA: SctL family type III secretion system stator protein PscL [Pseudomonas aeruginosa]
MLPFVELDASRVRLAPGQALLRARDYQDYLSANRLVEAARERTAEIEREAHEVYQEQKRLGWEAGLEEARLRQAGLIQETLLRCNRYYRQVDRQLGEVVLQAVRKVLRHYDAVELTLAATREALALVSNQKQVILHVQPEQLAAVREQVARVLKDFPEVGYLEVVGDARLDQGGCILETEIGIIDASLDSQLAALQAALTESVARSGEEEGDAG